MALGRQRDRQSELLVSWAEMPRSPGHVFYDRLQAELGTAGFDSFVEGQCAPYYAARQGRPSLPPGRHFRMLLVGYFEGIDSERALEWRCADSLSLREFLRLGEREPVQGDAAGLLALIEQFRRAATEATGTEWRSWRARRRATTGSGCTAC